MKILEARPRSYDRRMDRLSGGRVRAIKLAVAAEVGPGARVLEIGCGTAQLGAWMCERGAQVEGFDANPAMIAVARERIVSDGLDGRLSVREMGVENMDQLPQGAYDVVVATLVFSELSDDEQRYALEQAFRVLEPSGRLIIADEVKPRSAGRRAIHTARRVPAVVATYLVSRSSTQPLEDLRGAVERAGFVVEAEQRSHGDAFAVVVAHAGAERPARAAAEVGA